MADWELILDYADKQGNNLKKKKWAIEYERIEREENEKEFSKFYNNIS